LGFASNHVCASLGVKKLPQVANVPSWTPAVSVAGGRVVVVGVVVATVVGGAVVVAGVTVVVGVAVVVAWAVVVGTAVVVAWAVVVGTAVVVGAAVVVVATVVVVSLAAVSVVPPEQAETNNARIRNQAVFRFMIGVCHPRQSGTQ